MLVESSELQVASILAQTHSKNQFADYSIIFHWLIYGNVSVFPRSFSLSSREAKDSIGFLRVEIFCFTLYTAKCIHKRVTTDGDLVMHDVPVIQTSLLIARVKPTSVIAWTLAILLFACHKFMLFWLHYFVESIKMWAAAFFNAEFLAR